MTKIIARTADLNADRGDAYIPPCTDPASDFYQHAYRAELGWEILAGQDITDKKYNTTRFMLVHNPKAKSGPRAAILTASGKERAKWVPYAEGKTFDMMQLFDRLEGGPVHG